MSDTIAMSDKIALGSWVTYSATLFKSRYSSQTKWIRRKVAPERGLVIGIRTVRGGTTYWGDYEDWQWEFTPTESYRVYLIVNDIRRKPFHVLVEDAVCYGD